MSTHGSEPQALTASDRLDVSRQVRGCAGQRSTHLLHGVCPLGRGKALAEAGELVEALGEPEPGRAAVRQQEAGSVGQLEVGPRSGTRVLGSYGEAGEE